MYAVTCQAIAERRMRVGRVQPERGDPTGGRERRTRGSHSTRPATTGIPQTASAPCQPRPRSSASGTEIVDAIAANAIMTVT